MRPTRSGLNWRRAALLGLPILMGAHTQALAQMGRGESGISPNGIGNQAGQGARPVVPTATLPPTQRDVAPGLPGARTREDMVAPADRPAMQMRPTEALFDAINRGDIAATRDAIGRGAELNGRNILGFTPLETAVDLGRKDIVFLLLSLRGMDDRPNAAPPGVRPGSASAAFRALEQQQPAPRQDARRQPTGPRPAAEQAAPMPASARTPSQYAGDGGSPSPDAGFLGFGGASGNPRARQ